MRAWVVAGVGVAVGAVALWAWPKGHTIDPGNSRQVEQGRALYAQHCAVCHGEKLEGETADWQTRKPTGELPAPPHDAGGHTWHHPEEQLFAIVKHGMAHFAPPGYKTAMPSFVGTLSDGDIRAVLAYIESTWPPEIMERRAAMDKR